MTTVRLAEPRPPAARRPRQWRPTRRWPGSLGAWLVLLFWALVALGPVIWLLLALTKTSTELATRNPFAFGQLDRIATAWHNVLKYQDGVVIDWIYNTVILAISGVVLTLVITIPAGYALGTLRFPGRRAILVVSLILMLLPNSSLVLPLFLEMTQVNLVGSRLAVILPLSVFPFGLYVSFIYFSTTVSKDIYDAARLDGCSELQIFRLIALPLCRPVAALITFFAFIRNWNDFLMPFVMLGSDKYPLPVGITQLARFAPELSPGAATYASNIGVPEVLLVVVLTMLPVIIAILVAQRTIMRGTDILGGGLRG